ncbi:MAG TPA: hypothetical protein IAA56_08010, partial [Candidatus Galloscillospira excrementavium]|nr:hypothetical protein [Candidatus Galloscillospira excrementavium]
MKKLKKTLAVLLAATMVLGLLAACDDGSADVSDPPDSSATPAPSTDEYPITPEELGSGEVKWSEEETDDGWMKVTNEGGDTLGYSPDSGVTLLQVDGFAFKDLNQNGVLDLYEDWRQSNEDRAKNAVSLMSIEDMAGLRVSPLTMSANPEEDTALTLGEDEESTLEAYIQEAGLRYTDNMSYTVKGGLDNVRSLAEYANKLQVLSEGSGLGLPFVISADPSSILMGYTTQMVQASTFDTEVVNQLWQEVSKGY